MLENKSTSLPFNSSHAFIIGINNYQNLSPLRTAVNDAKVLAERLELQHGYKIHGASPGKPLLNPTKAELEILFNEIIPNEVEADDRLIIYFAGHGVALKGDDGSNGYLVPADAKQGKKDSLIPMDALHDLIEGLPCKHGMLILDCCFSGAFKWATGYRDLIMDLPNIIYAERFWRYCKDPAWQVITSSAHDQKAVDIIINQSIGMREEENSYHSPFAKALFNALDGAGDIIPPGEGDGVITATELYTYIRDAVENETIEQTGRQSPSMFTLRRHDKGEYIFLHPRHRLNLPPIPKRNPFKGLASYDEKDVQYFFGRDSVTKSLVKKVSEHSLVVISGASGTGKSSVIKAGILPKLKKSGWEILPIIRPGKEPLKILDDKLGDLSSILKKNKKGVLVIDQYEELITQCLRDTDQEAFEQKLSNWLEIYPQLKIIISVRSDFEPQFENGPLQHLWIEGRLTIPIFRPEDIREIISKPALQSVLFYENELNYKIEEEVGQAPGALPLLSFMLSELYLAYIHSGREDRALTEEDYEKIGRLKGALHTKADEVYKGLDEAHKNSLRRLMLRMVSLAGDEPASKRVYENELIFSDESESQRIKLVASKMVDARLIISDKDKNKKTYLEPAHDALVRSWGRLREWIKTVGEEKLIWQNKFSEAVAEYQEMVNKEARVAKKLLWNNNPRLDILKAELETGNHYLNASEESFVRKSVNKRTFTQQLVVGVSSILVVIFGSLAFWANNQTGIAENKTREAVSADSTTQCQIIEAEAQKWIALAAQKDEQKQRGIAEDKTIEAEDSAQSARVQRDIAIQQAFEAKVSALSAKASLMEATNPTIAYNMAYEACEMIKSPETVATFHDIASRGNPFYNKKLRHTDLITSLAFSPDGKQVIAGSYDKTIRIWSVETGKELGKFEGHSNTVISVDFSPDGKQIVSGSRDSTLRLWSVETGQEIRTLTGHSSYVYSVKFSLDGKQIISGSGDNTLRLWSVETGAEIRKFEGHTSIVNSVDFSPNGKQIVSGSWDKTARLWSTETGKEIRRFDGHILLVFSVAFSPNGKRVISSSSDNTIRLWSTETGKEIRRFRDGSKTIAFSPDGKQIISESYDNISLWSVETGELIRTFDIGDQSQVSSLAFSPDGKQIISGSHTSIYFWPVEANQELKIFEGHTDEIYSVAFSPNGKHIISGSADKTLHLWSLENKQKSLVFNGHTDKVNSVAFSPNGQQVISGSADHTLRLWSVSTGETLRTFEGHNGEVYSVAFSPNGDQVISGSADHTLRSWSVETGKEIYTFEGHTEEISTVVFSPDGKQIASGSSEDNTIRLWLAESGKAIRIFEGKTSFVNSLAFSQNGKQILSGARDQTIRLWSAETGKEIQSFEKNSESSPICSVVFSPNGKQVVSGSWSYDFYLWLTESGQELQIFKGHKDFVLSVDVSANGRYIISGSSDKTVRLWHNPLHSFPPNIYRLSAQERKKHGVDIDY